MFSLVPLSICTHSRIVDLKRSLTSHLLWLMLQNSYYHLMTSKFSSNLSFELPIGIASILVHISDISRASQDGLRYGPTNHTVLLVNTRTQSWDHPLFQPLPPWIHKHVLLILTPDYFFLLHPPQPRSQRIHFLPRQLQWSTNGSITFFYSSPTQIALRSSRLKIQM